MSPRHDSPEAIKPTSEDHTLDKGDFPGGERPRVDTRAPKGDKPGHQDNGGDHHRVARGELYETPEKAQRPHRAKDAQKKHTEKG